MAAQGESDNSEDLSHLLDAQCLMASAFAIAGERVPKNYNDIANMGDMADFWYASVASEL